MPRSLAIVACTACVVWPLTTSAQDFDIKTFFETAANAGRSGLAEKTKLVDARTANPARSLSRSSSPKGSRQKASRLNRVTWWSGTGAIRPAMKNIW
jgi:hypothetical protein